MKLVVVHGEKCMSIDNISMSICHGSYCRGSKLQMTKCSVTVEYSKISYKIDMNGEKGNLEEVLYNS